MNLVNHYQPRPGQAKPSQAKPRRCNERSAGAARKKFLSIVSNYPTHTATKTELFFGCRSKVRDNFFRLLMLGFSLPSSVNSASTKPSLRICSLSLLVTDRHFARYISLAWLGLAWPGLAWPDNDLLNSCGIDRKCCIQLVASSTHW